MNFYRFLNAKIKGDTLWMRLIMFESSDWSIKIKISKTYNRILKDLFNNISFRMYGIFFPQYICLRRCIANIKSIHLYNFNTIDGKL